ncbi:MAG: hypothetical protein SWH54_14930 [Thermodesulfobacteriota bacterium]|nr:hypothetical protein [Thermodesulfobacteriota bacterium]
MKTKATTMKTKARITLFGLVLVIALCYVNFANAESNFATGAGASADARLNFEIVIPPFVYFRVGTAGTTIDTINFSPTGNDVATGATTAGTGGDAGGGAVNVVLISNGGDVDITPSNNGGLTSGGNTISYSQINTNVTGSITAPTLTDAGGSTETILANASGIINLTSVWSYEYINPAIPPAVGTYTDQVTYTAVLP